MTTCELGCGNPLDKDDPTIWKQVVGWVGGPKKDSMRLRADTGKFAHDECVAKLSAGQAVDQPNLFDIDPMDADTNGIWVDADLPEELR